jgi:hypothetical protein
MTGSISYSFVTPERGMSGQASPASVHRRSAQIFGRSNVRILGTNRWWLGNNRAFSFLGTPPMSALGAPAVELSRKASSPRSQASSQRSHFRNSQVGSLLNSLPMFNDCLFAPRRWADPAQTAVCGCCTRTPDSTLSTSWSCLSLQGLPCCFCHSSLSMTPRCAIYSRLGSHTHPFFAVGGQARNRRGHGDS